MKSVFYYLFLKNLATLQIVITKFQLESRKSIQKYKKKAFNTFGAAIVNDRNSSDKLSEHMVAKRKFNKN